MEDPAPAPPFTDIKGLLQAQADNDHGYLINITDNHESTEVSYAEFYQQVLGCARFLQNRGLRRGDRIATIAHNHWHTIVQYYAAWMLGLAVVPINLEENDEDIANILRKGKIELAFVRTEYRNRFRKILELYDNLKHIEWIVCEGRLNNFTDKKGELAIDESSCAESEALVMFNSDANGIFKGAVLSQQNLLEEAWSIAEWHGIDEKTRMMCVQPIHHIESLAVMLVTPFLAGGTTVLRQQFHPEYFFRDVVEEEVTIVGLKATHLQSLDSYYKESVQPETAPLHHIICEGSRLTAEIAEMFESRFNVPVISGYNLPETTSYSCFMPVDSNVKERNKWRHAYEYSCIGRAVSANEVAIHDQSGKALGEKERGEIVIRGTNVMLKYYNHRKANEEVFKNGWLRSGDEGFYINDKKGRPYFFIAGQIEN